MSAAPDKTFYLETFGCQMNVHDSEKVIGTLMHGGYRQVQTVEQADLILYNTCSIRDKAEQKVFNRLNDYKKLLKQGKKFGVLGCVAQQEGEKIFERAPWVSLVCGSASYRNLPQMLAQLEAGTQAAAGKSGIQELEADFPEPMVRSPKNTSLIRITGLDDRETDECFETEFTARTNPHRGYITIIEGCDKFCAYCVVPFTRGKERSRTSDSVLAEARQMADLGLHRDSIARPEREFLQRSVGQENVRGIAGRCGRGAGNPSRALYHLASPRFWTRHHPCHRCRAHALRSRAPARAERIEPRA